MTSIGGLRMTALALVFTSAGFLATAAWAQTPNSMATLICRPAAAGETANAKMMATSTTLVCESFALNLPMSDGTMKTIGSVTAKPMSGPDFTGALTVQQDNAAYTKWVQQTFRIDPARVHQP
jgi:hypothetical protein